MKRLLTPLILFVALGLGIAARPQAWTVPDPLHLDNYLEVGSHFRITPEGIHETSASGFKVTTDSPNGAGINFYDSDDTLRAQTVHFPASGGTAIYDADGGLRFDLSWSDAGDNLNLQVYDANGSPRFNFQQIGSAVALVLYGQDDMAFFDLTSLDEGPILLDIGTSTAELRMKLKGLPTSDPHNAGQLWNDSGTLKVSAGP